MGLLKFPTGVQKPASPAPSLAAPVQMEKLELAQAQSMLLLVDRELDGMAQLVEYLDANRDDAQSLGVESLAIELSAVLEGQGLETAKDALEDAIERQKPAFLTRKTLDRIRRVERLLQEAGQALSRGGLSLSSIKSAGLSGRQKPTLGITSDQMLTGAALFFGITIGAIVLIAVFRDNPRWDR